MTFSLEYQAPVRDSDFILRHILDLREYRGGQGTPLSPAPEDVLNTAASLAETTLFPLNSVGDGEGCTWHPDGSVTTPTGFSEGYQSYLEAGLASIAVPVEYGGRGLSAPLAFAAKEYSLSANQSLEMYHALTGGAISAILAVGSAQQKAYYIPPMAAGRWTGAMALSEPQAGTDLGRIEAEAVPNDDGSYHVSGTKIFISAGEHDLSDNIIHLVLARTPDAPPGSRGISMFIVPKWLTDAEGRRVARNSVRCSGIETKMGHAGNATCTMLFDDAKGWLIGRENRGLAGMFIMMNASRLAVGLQGIAQAEIARQNAARYAACRRQGRAPVGAAEPNFPADPIATQPDVRRMIAEAGVLVEGLRALCLWGWNLWDISKASENGEERGKAEALLGVLTPIIKGYGSDKAFEITVAAQQVFGGYGYLRTAGMEQFVRDVRIAQIYEGTNGVQAMDLASRKLEFDDGRAMTELHHLVANAILAGAARPRVAALAAAVDDVLTEHRFATSWLRAASARNPDDVAAGAYAYLHLSGIAALGLMWLRMACKADVLLATDAKDAAATCFLEAKLASADCFAERITPDAYSLRRKVEVGSETLMRVDIR